jgi:acetylornithine deacetylase/succinyl-diaminopimelate desuccinylase-like protein
MATPLLALPRSIPLCAQRRHRSARWLPGLLTLGLLTVAGCTNAERDGADQIRELAADATESPESSSPPAILSEAAIREMDAILADDGVQQALAYLEAIEPRSLQDLIRLNEIPAPPFMEEVRAAAYAEMLRAAGADSVWIDGIGNVLALRRGTTSTRTVALDGHLDTVFPIETDVTVQIRGDTLFAPGIGDDTRGLIVVRNVLEAMAAHDLRTEADLLFIGTVGEEGLGDLRGVKYLFGENGPGIDAFIAVDGGDESRVVNQGVGSYRYRVTFRGPGGHSWGAFGLANPHNALAGAIQHFVADADRLTQSGPRTSYNIGRIGGGTSVNSIPFESWMEVDMRSLDPTSLGNLDARLQAAIQRALEEENALRRRGAALTVDVDMVGNRPAGLLDPNETFLIQRAMASVTALSRTPSIGSGSTNANTPISLGIPAITIGRGGDGGNAHALDEWWLPVNPHLATQNALLITLAEGGFPSRTP